MRELLAWVAGFAALAGLIAEVARRSTKEDGVALVGGLLVVYLIYVTLSVRAFWKTSRIAMPITLLIGAALWTISLKSVDRSDLRRATISAIFIPLAMTYSVRLFTPKMGKGEESDEVPVGPTTIHALLDKGKGLGNRVDFDE